MADDVLLNKAATIKRCVARAREEYAAAAPDFATDFTRQDAAVLNIQRACEAALDMGQHVIRREGLGLPHPKRRRGMTNTAGAPHASCFSPNANDALRIRPPVTS